MPTMDDIPSLHLQIVHRCGQGETRWYDSPLLQTVRSPEATPTKFRPASRASDQPTIPSPDIFRSLTDETPKSATALPTAGECAVHLELLEVFHALRTRIISTRTLDWALGIRPATKTVYRRTWVGHRKYENKPTTVKDPTFEERSRRKWRVYLEIAATRFIIWSEKIEALMREVGGPHAEARIPHLPPLGEFPPPPPASLSYLGS